MNRKARIYALALKETLEKTRAPAHPNVVRRFVAVLKKTGQFRMAGSILLEFKKLWLERRGKQARVVTALPLSKAQKLRIANVLKKKGFFAQEEVNPSIIGGTAIFLGSDYLIDNTVKGKLQRIFHG